jgi:hypothetical protein
MGFPVCEDCQEEGRDGCFQCRPWTRPGVVPAKDLPAGVVQVVRYSCGAVKVLGTGEMCCKYGWHPGRVERVKVS